MMRACSLAAWVLMLASYSRVASADGLRQVQRATSGGTGSDARSTSSGGSSRSGSSSSGSWDESDGEACVGVCDPRDSLAFWIAAFTIGAPWTIPRLFFDEPTLDRYASYPFANGPGLLRREEDPFADGARKVAIALDAESGYMLQGVVPSGLALRVMLPRRVELDARFHGLSDVRESPVVLASAGTAHVTYRFAQGRRYDFRTGLGVRTFALDAWRVGFDLFYGVDTYLARRVVWRIELHLGTAGDAFVGQARTTVGAMVHRFELYAGYDHTAYLSATHDAALGGPVAGLRAWF